MLAAGAWVIELVEMLESGGSAGTGAMEDTPRIRSTDAAVGSVGFEIATMEVSGRGEEIKLLTGELSAEGVCEALELEPEPDAEPGETAEETAAPLDLRCISASTAAETPAFTGFTGPGPIEARTFVTPAAGCASIVSVTRRCCIFLNALRRSSSVFPSCVIKHIQYIINATAKFLDECLNIRYSTVHLERNCIQKKDQ